VIINLHFNKIIGEIKKWKRENKIDKKLSLYKLSFFNVVICGVRLIKNHPVGGWFRVKLWLFGLAEEPVHRGFPVHLKIKINIHHRRIVDQISNQ